MLLSWPMPVFYYFYFMSQSINTLYNVELLQYASRGVGRDPADILARWAELQKKENYKICIVCVCVERTFL